MGEKETAAVIEPQRFGISERHNFLLRLFRRIQLQHLQCREQLTRGFTIDGSIYADDLCTDVIPCFVLELHIVLAVDRQKLNVVFTAGHRKPSDKEAGHLRALQLDNESADVDDLAVVFARVIHDIEIEYAEIVVGNVDLVLCQIER